MKITKEKGITLIALVVTIVVLLILAGVSLVAVVGENGLIAKAKESIMLTQLADVLFDFEENLLDVKTEKIGQKLTITQILNKLGFNNPNKYTISSMYTKATGIGTMALSIKTSPIPNFLIGLNGDVYINNYKRGKVQISDIYQEIEAEGCIYGNSKLKVNDGYIFDNHVFSDLYEIYYMNQNENVPWVNETNEIVAWSDKFSTYLTGIRDHEFAAYNLAWLEEGIDMYDGKYVLFPATYCKQDGNDILAEMSLYHFMLNTIVPTGNEYEDLSNPGETIKLTPDLLMGGTYITEITLKFSPNPNLEEPYITCKFYDSPVALTYEECLAVSKHYVVRCRNMKEYLESAGITSSRIYYVPIITYRKFAEEKIDDEEHENIEYYYYDEENSYIGNTVKYIDFEK